MCDVSEIKLMMVIDKKSKLRDILVLRTTNYGSRVDQYVRGRPLTPHVETVLYPA